MAIDHSFEILRRIQHLTTVLKPLGLSIPDAPNTSDPVIPTVTREDIAEAVAAAKDPASDKTVQRLVTAHQLDGLGIAAGLRTIRAKAHDNAVRDALPHINEDLHNIFNNAAEQLQEHGEQFKGHQDLGALNLATLPAHSAAAAGAALDACRTMEAVRTAWVGVTTYGATPGHRAHFTDYGAPTQEQYQEARDARPQTFPAPTPWAVYRKGWTLDLPQTVKAAQQRRADYQTAAERAEQKQAQEARRTGLRGGSL